MFGCELSELSVNTGRYLLPNFDVERFRLARPGYCPRLFRQLRNCVTFDNIIIQ
jgi:hypothetical protein